MCWGAGHNDILRYFYAKINMPISCCYGDKIVLFFSRLQAQFQLSLPYITGNDSERVIAVNMGFPIPKAQNRAWNIAVLGGDKKVTGL